MTIKRVNKAKKNKPFVSKRRKVSDFEVSLADEISVPSTRLGDYTLWIHGAPGVGKSTLSAEFPNTHQFMAEVGGAKAIASYQKPVTHWLEWCAYVQAWQKDKKFKTGTIDVLEQLYALCFDYMCQEVMHIEHPTDQKDFGKSWGKITNEFMRSMKQFRAAGKGTVLISHSVERPITTFLGEKYELIRPNLGGSVLNSVAGDVDIIGYLYAEGSKRFLRIREDGDTMAKVRPTKNFFWPDGEPIEVIPMGRSPKEGYANLIAAFANKLPRPPREAKKKRKLRK